jgi:hypothetical protein
MVQAPLISRKSVNINRQSRSKMFTFYRKDQQVMPPRNPAFNSSIAKEVPDAVHKS